MTDPDETRRALCSFETEGLAGAPARGDGEARVDDDGVSVGGVCVEFLDVDTLADERRVVSLGVHPAGTLRISMLARRHETFAAALDEARDAPRVTRGLLAHGLGTPEAFDGAVLEPGPARDAGFLVWPTHVAVVPAGGDPFQIPLGARDGRLLRRGDVGGRPRNGRGDLSLRPAREADRRVRTFRPGDPGRDARPLCACFRDEALRGRPARPGAANSARTSSGSSSPSPRPRGSTARARS